MTPAFFFIISDAGFAPILTADGPTGTNKIQGYVSMAGFTYYLTTNLTPPGGTVYAKRLNADGSVLVSQSVQPGLTGGVKNTFYGWSIPA